MMNEVAITSHRDFLIPEIASLEKKSAAQQLLLVKGS